MKNENCKLQIGMKFSIFNFQFSIFNSAFWILALWSASAAAISINDFTAARNNRFDAGYNTGPLVANTDPSFIGLGYDWSGVGWDTASGKQSFALITPRQMLIANHYQPGIGNAIGFA